MTARDRWIDRHLRRLHIGQFLQRAAEWVSIYLFCFGTTVLVVKMLLPSLWPQVLWVAVGGVPVAIAAWWTSRTGRFTRGESVALLDQSLHAGGLLMTLTEVPHEEWEARLPQVERRWRESLPRIRPRRLSSSLMLPLLFAVGACFVPLREIVAKTFVKNTAGEQATGELENLLQSLEDTKVLEEQEEETLREAIEKLQEETDHSPLTHEKWETVDALEQRMRMQLDEASINMSQAAQAAALLAKAADGEGLELSEERLAQLEQEVLETLQKMSQNGGLASASAELKNELKRLMKNGELRLPPEGEAREKLMNELQEFLDQESEKLSKLRKECEGACSQCGKECQGGLCAACSGNKPGRGGVNRGRGDAEMTWGDESDEAGVKFKETVLPPGMLDSPKDEVLEITKNIPDENPSESLSRGAARTIDPAAGRETWNRTLRPRHRAAVRKFFDNEE